MSHRRRVPSASGGPPEIIPLNLIADYPVRWDRFKVLRDLLQNFYDAVGYRQWRTKFTWERKEGELILRADKIDFCHEWLLHIGASTKREGQGYAGYFGEGFKIAALCALRDYGWTVAMRSRDWKLAVAFEPVVVDGRTLRSLAYHVWRFPESRENTELVLSPFGKDGDDEILDAALLSFYDPDNPLFGAAIWSDDSVGFHHRSQLPRPRFYPSTFNDRGPGIVFAAFQAVGSFSFPLIVALHTFRQADRERNTFYKMDVVKLIGAACGRLPPGPAREVLKIFRSKWYSYPHKKYDFESWTTIIRTLVSRVAACPIEAEEWRAEFPGLLAAPQVSRKTAPAYNRRRQALDWLRQKGGSHRLVQDGFTKLGYPILEDVCERADGFNVARIPSADEARWIQILEHLTECILDGFFGIGENLPPCRILESDPGPWQGLALCVRRPVPTVNRLGLLIPYQLPYVALKRSLLKSGQFHEALSTYLHELSHCFGGDQSRRFSHALTLILAVTMKESSRVLASEREWEALAAARTESPCAPADEHSPNAG